MEKRYHIQSQLIKMFLAALLCLGLLCALANASPVKADVGEGDGISLEEGNVPGEGTYGEPFYGNPLEALSEEASYGNPLEVFYEEASYGDPSEIFYEAPSEDAFYGIYLKTFYGELPEALYGDPLAVFYSEEAGFDEALGAGEAYSDGLSLEDPIPGEQEGIRAGEGNAAVYSPGPAAGIGFPEEELLDDGSADILSLEEDILSEGEEKASALVDGGLAEVLDGGAHPEDGLMSSGTPLVEEQIRVNPLYENVINEEALRERLGAYQKPSPLPGRDVPAVGEDNPYFEEFETASNYLTGQLKQREKEILLMLRLPSNEEEDYYSLMQMVLFTNSTNHTGVPDEGDYLDYNILGFGSSCWVDSQAGDDWYVAMYYMVDYSTTKAEEDVVEMRVRQILDSLALDGLSEYEKIEKIYHYVAGHVTYDYDHLNDETYLAQYSAYGALINGKAVCQGYSLLLYRLMLEAGIDCRIVTGIGNGNPHAWNIVKIGDYYYNVDVTWDSEVGNDTFFLRCNEHFPNHERDELYDMLSFDDLYPMSPVDYNRECVHVYKYQVIKASPGYDGLIRRICEKCGNVLDDETVLPMPERITLEKERYTYNGQPVKPAVTVWDKEGNALDKSQYTVIYPTACTDVRASAYKVRVKLKGRYEGELSAYYYIDKASVKLTLNSAKKLLPSLNDGIALKVSVSASKGDEGTKIGYTTNNENIVTVDEAGNVTPRGVGGATVVAYYPGSKNYKYANTKVYVFVRPEKVNFTSVTNTKGVLKMAWNMCRGCTYQIQYSKDPAFKEHTTLTVNMDSKTTYSKGGLDAGETYYLRIRSHMTSNGKNYFSYWSPTYVYTMS